MKIILINNLYAGRVKRNLTKKGDIMGQTDGFLNLDQEIPHDDSLSGEVGDRPTLIDALRYYADEQNYDENGAPGNFVGTASGDVWELDEGKIAKEVLKLIKK